MLFFNVVKETFYLPKGDHVSVYNQVFEIVIKLKRIEDEFLQAIMQIVSVTMSYTGFTSIYQFSDQVRLYIAQLVLVYNMKINSVSSVRVMNHTFGGKSWEL